MNALHKDAEAVDPAFIDQLLSALPEEDVFTLLGTCLNDARHRVSQIRSAKLPQDLDEVAWNAHDLKSSAGQLGAVRLSDIAQEVDLYCKSLDSSDDIDLPYLQERCKEIINLFTDVSDTLHNKYLCRAENPQQYLAG